MEINRFSLMWRIYYDSGEVFSSTDGEPEDAPSFGVIAIVNIGKHIQNRYDWYYWQAEENQWWGSDIHGLLDQLLHNKPIKAIKQGRNTEDTLYAEIISRATKDLGK